jgi:hypothetical protein
MTATNPAMRKKSRSPKKKVESPDLELAGL